MKRFTDTGKWKDPWFRRLPYKYKIFWLYLCDNCDNAGIWVKDIEEASHLICAHINEVEVLERINSEKERIKVIFDGKKWLIADFISFQYGQLTEKNTLHRHVLALLEKQGVSKEDVRGIYAPKVKEKEKEKERVEVKEKKGEEKVVEKEGEPPFPEFKRQAIEYLNNQTRKNFSSDCKATERFLRARYSEKRTIAEIKLVIDNRVAKWLKDEKMIEYLRPETLFNATKFEGYLVEARVEEAKKIEGKRKHEEYQKELETDTEKYQEELKERVKNERAKLISDK